MDNDLQRVLDKQKADKTKQQVKKLLLQIDTEKQGHVTSEVFQQICQLHHIILGPSNFSKLLKSCRPVGNVNAPADSIQYKLALQKLSINMEVDQPLMKEWIVRSGGLGQERAYSTIATSLGMASSVMSTHSAAKGNDGRKFKKNAMAQQLQAMNRGISSQNLHDIPSKLQNNMLSPSRQQLHATTSLQNISSIKKVRPSLTHQSPTPHIGNEDYDSVELGEVTAKDIDLFNKSTNFASPAGIPKVRSQESITYGSQDVTGHHDSRINLERDAQRLSRVEINAKEDYSPSPEARRGRSPSQPSQKNILSSSVSVNKTPSYQLLNPPERPADWFEGNQKKKFSMNWSGNQTSFQTESYNKQVVKPSSKLTNSTSKNTGAEPNFNVISNLPSQYHKDGSGVSPRASYKPDKEHVSVSLGGIPKSERELRGQGTKKEKRDERPTPMRHEVVDNYITEVMAASGGERGVKTDIIRSMYKLHMDNRILNNLRQQLNELISDERGLIPVSEFRKMFFTFFKGEKSASIIYDMLLPCISVVDQGNKLVDGIVVQDFGSVDTNKKMVSVQQLTQFIDMFNYYPIQVNKLRQKNDSNELTFVMSSNTKGSDQIGKQESKPEQTEDQRHLLKLLSLVSLKIYERFRTLQAAFRYLDTDHTQSISLNEFAQAVDHLRLKMSFDDICKLYRYMDREGKGEIGYDEFTLLTEERWRGIDPFEQMKNNMSNANQRSISGSGVLSSAKTTQSKSYLDCDNEVEMLQRLENLSKNNLKIPLKKEVQMENLNINRLDAKGMLAKSFEIKSGGMPANPSNNMNDVLKHDYLRQSMEQRVHRKQLIRDHKASQISALKRATSRPTKTSQLRSQSVLGQLEKSKVEAESSSSVMHNQDFANLKQRLRRIAQSNLRRKTGLVLKENDSRVGDFDYQEKTPQAIHDHYGSLNYQRTPGKIPTVYGRSNSKMSPFTKSSTMLPTLDYNTIQLTESNLKDAYGSQLIDPQAANQSVMSKQERDEMVSNYYSQKKNLNVGNPIAQKKIPILKPLPASTITN